MLIAIVTFQVVDKRKWDNRECDTLNVRVYGQPNQFPTLAHIEQEARRLAPQWLAQHEGITERLIMDVQENN